MRETAPGDTSVQEYVFYVFSYFKKHDFLRFIWHDVSKSRKKIINITKQQAFETKTLAGSWR